MNRDIVAGIVMLGVSAAYYYGGAILPTSILDTAVSSSTFPKILGAAGVVLSAILVVQGVLKLRTATPGAPWLIVSEWPRHRKALGLLAVGFGYVILLNFFGYVVALLALIPTVAIYHGVKPGRTLALVTIGGAALFWLFFVKLLGIHMPPGTFWRAVGLIAY